MKNVLKLSLAVIVAFCFSTRVNAATQADLVSYLTSEHVVSGKTLVVSDANAVRIQRFFDDVTLSDADATTIIGKLDAIINQLESEGVSFPSELSSAGKQTIFGLGQEAAALVNLTMSYDSANEAVILYDASGSQTDVVPVAPVYDPATGEYVIGESTAQRTGNDYTIFVAFSGIFVALGAASIFRKLKVNA